MIGSYIFIFIGTLVTAYGLIQFFKNQKTLNWISTKGVIIENQLIRKISNTNDNIDYTYECQVKYKYKPRGMNNEIIGNRILPFILIGNYKDNLEFNKTLKIGTELKVHYNPKKVEECCLIKGQNYAYKIILTLGFICLFFGLIVYFSKTKEKTEIEILNKIEIIE